jgi:hypothetical protein
MIIYISTHLRLPFFGREIRKNILLPERRIIFVNKREIEKGIDKKIFYRAEYRLNGTIGNMPHKQNE